MALQVWLPFNNNTVNQGLNVDFSLQAGTPAYSDGKITSKCLNVTSNTSALKYPLLVDGKSYSVCGWFNVNSYVSYNTFFCNGSDNGNGWFVRCSGSISTLNFQCFNKAISYTSFQANTWYHICVVIDAVNKNAYLYINGVLQASMSSYTQGTSSANGGFNIGKLRDTYYHMNGRINDFRIYDHCLSNKEIKELSKGLCIHYKLSRGGENLIKGTPTYNSPNSGSVTINWDDNLKNNFSSYASKKITLSYDYEINNIKIEGTYGTRIGCEFNYYSSSANQTNKTLSYIGLWWKPGIGYSGVGHKSVTVTMPSTIYALNGLGSFYVQCTSDNIKITNIKLEEGDHATSWIPHKSDTLYSQLGYSSTEPDCSGYGNDGTIKGTPAYSNNTPRYEGSTFIPSGGVFGSRKYPDNTDSITISAWVKASNIASQSIVGNWESGGCGIYTNSSKKAIFEYYDGSVYKTVIGTTTLSNDTWYLITGVFSYTDKKAYIYVNGVLEASVAVSTYIRIGSATNVPMSIGNPNTTTVSGITNCFVSDVRVYATALSASDIKALYDTPISIDNKGNLYCGEVIE